MLKNYFSIAWRIVQKNRVSSFINICGLAVGLAVAILTGLWLKDELSFNKYHGNYEHIAKVAIKGTEEKGRYVSSTLSYPLVNELKTKYSDRFKYLVRASWVQECILSSGDQNISGTGQYMDEEAPDLFTLKMIRGSRDGLRDIHSIMLAASLARSLFGNADPMGKIISINNKTHVKVAGVYEDLPMNTDLHQVSFIAPFVLWIGQIDWIGRAENDWTNHFLKLFAAIKPGTNFEAIDRQIENIEIEHIKQIKDLKHQQQLKEHPQAVLLPMAGWHLQGSDRRGNPDASVKRMVWLVALIGTFVLLLACINFMNLSTARFEKRAHEVGIRKVIGSLRIQLVLQFFCESLAMVAIAFMIALLLATASLGWFNQLADKQMKMPWSDPFCWMACIAFIFITGIISGSYPALFLSSFRPIKALKGGLSAGRGAVLLRKGLVVFQFTISIALINCTIIILQQVQHAKDRPVGYTREGLLMMKMKSDDFQGKYDLIRQELMNTGVVAEFAESMGKVTEIASGNGGFDWQGKDESKDPQFGTLAVSAEYGKAVGWQFIEGRDFSRSAASDSMGMVINESAMREMGLKEPVGTDITWTWWMDRTKVLHYKIIGVVKDMIMESPYEDAKPVVFYQKGHNGGLSWMIIKVKPDIGMSRALPQIAAVMKKLIPTAPFDYKFVDEDYAMKFSAEQRISRLAGFFAALAIFISALGLFGLASFTAEQRTKEVGIRKILGASVLHVWGLLSVEFVLLVMASLLIAVPVAYYSMYNWLQNYHYRVSLSPWIFVLSGVAALLIALATVSAQAIKAAVANPVKSLRTE